MTSFSRISISTALIATLCAPAVFGQELNVATNNNEDDEIENVDTVARPWQQHRSVALLLGTAGIGAQGNITLSKSWGIRAGFQIMPAFTISQDDKIGRTDVEHKYKINLANIHVLADYYLPFAQKIGLRVTGGLAGFVSAKANVVSVPIGEYYYGDIPINDERMGEVKTKVNRSGVAAYLGAGFLNLVNTKHFGLSADIGSYYLLPAADVEMTASGYLSGNERNQEQLKENLKGYRWLPVIQLGFHYKF